MAHVGVEMHIPFQEDRAEDKVTERDSLLLAGHLRLAVDRRKKESNQEAVQEDTEQQNEGKDEEEKKLKSN